MAEMVKRNLVLTFATAGGKSLTLTVNTPNSALQNTDVAAAMDKIIEAGAFGSEETVSTKVEAKYVTQEVEKIELA